MSFIDSVKGTVSTAVDTITSVTQGMVDKNRTNAKLNRLRTVMKNESELMNRAYIALGKLTFESAKKGDTVSEEQQKKLFEVIEKSKSKIAKARECYREIVDSTNDIFYGAPDSKIDYKKEDVIDITVACSNEEDYVSSPFAQNVECDCTCVDVDEAFEADIENDFDTEAEAEVKVEKKEFIDISSNSVAEDIETEDEEFF